MWNTFTTADPSVSSAAAFIPLNSGEWMHPATSPLVSVLFQSVSRTVCRRGWKSWMCPSCSVHCAAFHPLFVYTWTTSATVYKKKNVTFDTVNAPTCFCVVEWFALSLQGPVYSHCTWHLPTPDITSSKVVELRDFWHKPEKGYRLLAKQRPRRKGNKETGNISQMSLTAVLPVRPSIHPAAALKACVCMCVCMWWIIIPAATSKAVV